MALGFSPDNGALTTNLVSYWNLDGNSTDTADSKNGTDTSITYGSAYGKINQGASLNGTSSKIALADSSFQYTGDFSVSAWIYATATGWRSIMSNYIQSSGYGGWTLRLDTSSKIDLTIITNTTLGTESHTLTTNAISLNAWHHVVFVRTGSTGVKIYVDN